VRLIFIVAACSLLRRSLSFVYVVKSCVSRIFPQQYKNPFAAKPQKYPEREGEDTENQAHSYVE
jgi:hypothetical protein